jgi:hypothetical protein
VRFDGGVSMVLMLQQDEINQVLRAPAEAGDKQ